MTKHNSNHDEFVSITNKDIYNELQSMKKEMREGFESVNRRQDITNGKVKLTRWMATTCLTLIILLFGFVMSNLASARG